MKNTIIRPKTHEEWLAVRKGGIGSSDIGSIVGLNDYETPYQLWRSKVGLDAPKEQTFAMTAGHYLEPAVAQFFEDNTGRQVIKASAGDWIIRADEKPWLQVSPDRTYWIDAEGKKNEENKGIVECKTTQLEIDADNLPPYWYAQLQYQLGVAGYKEGYLAWLTCGRSFGYRRFDFDPVFFDWLVEEADAFYHENIVGMKEPDMKNAADVMAKYAMHTEGKVAEAPVEIYIDYMKLKELKENIAMLDAEKKKLENGLKIFFKDAEMMMFEGSPIATFKAPKAGVKFDTEGFKRDHPDLYKQYCYEVKNSRRLLLK